ncbi:MAG: penicillin acylase family protein, partial [bacterium]
PQYVNPNSGFLFNTNHSSFYATAGGDNLKAESFSKTDGWETNHNNRSIRFLELISENSKVDFDRFKTIKFDRQLPSKLHYPIGIDTLFLMRPEEYPAYDTILRNLQQWDRKGLADSKGAGAFLMVYEFVSARLRGREGIQIGKTECEQVLAEIKTYLLKHFGKTDLALGEMQKLVRGDKQFPAHGLPDLLAPEWSVRFNGGVRKVTGGDAYVALVRFPKNGLPIIETSNTYGASAKKGSPHFDDQIPLFLDQKTKRMSMDRKEVLEKAVRTYHPGE